MSHFTVLVIGENPEAQLAPYHEFECTGRNDQYVKEIERLPELLKEYLEQTRRVYRDAEGNYHPTSEAQFYRDPTDADRKKHGNMDLMGTGSGNGDSWTSRDWEDGRGYRTRFALSKEEVEALGFTEARVTHQGLGKSFVDWLKDWHGWDEDRFLPRGTEPDREGTHKYGYAITDETLLIGEGLAPSPAWPVVSVIDRTNPDRKWDWYQMGGRWSGYFLLKKLEGRPRIQDRLRNDPVVSSFANKLGFAVGEVLTLVNLKTENPDKFEETVSKYNGHGELVRSLVNAALAILDDVATEVYAPGTLGEKSWMTLLREEKNGKVENYAGRADQALKGDIDFDAMREKARVEANAQWDEFERLFGALPAFKPWSWFYETYLAPKESVDSENTSPALNRDEVSKLYREQPVIKAADALRDNKYIDRWNIDDFAGETRETYVGYAVKNAIASFAVVKDSKWYEKGEMGWFASVSNEKDREVWLDEFNKLLDEAPDDTLLTVVDCHI